MQQSAAERPLADLLSGLTLRPASWRKAALAVLASIAGVTAFIVLLDALLFRHSLPADYVAHYTSPLVPRMFAACLAALRDEIVFRLGLMTALVMLLTWRRGRLSPGWFVFAILAVQLVNVGGIVLADPLYGTLRFWLVGSVWGWLYWRHGGLAALAGHGAAHLALDPALLVVLRA